MDLSVVVPTYRRPAELSRCLGGLAAQERQPEEVVIVARGEDAETWRALAGAPATLPVRPLRVGAAGVVRALNAALDVASGDLIAITDDDAVPRPDWLRRLESRFVDDERVGGVGGRDLVHEHGVTRNASVPVVGRVRWYGRVIGNHHLGSGPPRRVELLKGVNMAFRRQAVRGVRIDEHLRGQGAQQHWEIDLCLAVAKARWKIIYDPAIVVDHYPAQRFDEDQRVGRPVSALENEVYNESRALLRHLPPWRAAMALSYGLVVGTRRAPGLVVALERGVRGERVRERLVASERARIAALGERVRGW